MVDVVRYPFQHVVQGWVRTAPFTVVRYPRVPARDVDIHYGGPGVIVGTVKVAPATPVRKRVVLLANKSLRPIAEVYSDATTGAYRFDRLSTSLKFLVISFDDTHSLRAVIADYLTAEVE